MLSNREIEGAILTVPNEQYLPVAAEVAKARKHVYTEKPIASSLLSPRFACKDSRFSSALKN